MSMGSGGVDTKIILNKFTAGDAEDGNSSFIYDPVGLGAEGALGSRTATPPPPEAAQVWSLYQFYYVGFSQSRIGVVFLQTHNNQRLHRLALPVSRDT